MEIRLPQLYEQVGELNRNITETTLACHEIAGRAFATVVTEQNKMFASCLETTSKYMGTVSQLRLSRELLVQELQTFTECAYRMRQSVWELQGIQQVAAAEMNLCLQDGWKAIQSRPALGRS